MEWLLHDDSTLAKVLRTIIEGVISALITYAPDLISQSTFIPDQFKALVIALFMAVFTAILSAVGNNVAARNAAKRMEDKK